MGVVIFVGSVLMAVVATTDYREQVFKNSAIDQELMPPAISAHV